MTKHMMKGWEAFDAIHPDRDNDPIIRSLGGDEDWPPDEVANGVAHILISTNGDCHGSSFVKVSGPDRNAVAACYLRCRAAVLAGTFTALLETGAEAP